MATSAMRRSGGSDVACAGDDLLLQALEDYWWSVKPEDGLPGRQDIDPLDVPRLLPWLYLIDVVPAEGPLAAERAFRYCVRLFGTGLVEKFQCDVTGRWLDGLYPEPHISRMIAGYDEVVAARRPLRADFVIPVEGREFLNFRRVACPLASDHRTVDMLVGVHDYTL